MNASSDPRTPQSDSRMTRRHTLQVAGAALAGSAAPRLLHAADKAGAKKVTLGKGRHTYEVHHDWLTPPRKIRFGDTHGVCFDGEHRIYIFHTVHPDSESPDTVCVFDEKGKFIKSWGKEYQGGAHGMDLRKEGKEEFFYLCDIHPDRRRVVKTTLDGEKLWEMSVPEEAGVYKEKSQYRPTNVAFAPNGDFYVADGYGSHYIHQYDKDANYLRTFGGPGEGEGQLKQPHGITVDTRGKTPRVLVADRANHRLQYFTLDGKHLGFVKGDVRMPCHFDEYKGMLLIPDLDSRVTLLDKDNKLITHLSDGPVRNGFRGKPREAFQPGDFYHPHDAAFDPMGNIVVAEWLPIGRITLLRHVNA